MVSSVINLYKFKGDIQDVVLIDSKFMLCAFKNILNVYDLEKKDIVSKKFGKEKFSKIIMLDDEEEKFLTFEIISNNIYKYSFYRKNV